MGGNSMDIKELRETTGLSQQKFGEKFRIPASNISHWEQGIRKAPDYVIFMMERILELEKKK